MRIQLYRKILSHLLVSCLALFILPCCANKHQQNLADVKPGHLKHVQKPGSTYQDSLMINSPAAVFFHADSIQLQKLKSLLDDQVFKGSMHEYYYMVRNAHIFLHNNWADLAVVEANTVRYLVFHYKNDTKEVIDLDNEQDPIGMLVFDGQQKPLLIDMTNIDTQVPAYFNTIKKTVRGAVR